jgi:phenylalanine-4-hydroxylase
MTRRAENDRSDWTVPQNWDRYSADEHRLWDQLYARQMKVLPGRAADAFLHGLDRLQLHGAGIPDFRKLNAELSNLTGWSIVAVPGLVPDEVFFEHLANRRFPAGRFIRRPDQLDYISEPDVFHDVFGHAPLLADPVFADYLQAYGAGGLRSIGLHALDNLARLYWYTVEFGLIATPAGMRIYGAGIVSSPAESVFALESASPHRIGFDLERIMRTLYRIDDFQQTYFVIESFEQLFAATAQDFAPIYKRLASAGALDVCDLLLADTVLQRGDQSHLARA